MIEQSTLTYVMIIIGCFVGVGFGLMVLSLVGGIMLGAINDLVIPEIKEFIRTINEWRNEKYGR